MGLPFQLALKGEAVSAAVAARVSAIRVSDSTALENDRVEISFFDRGDIAWPALGVEVALSIGWGSALIKQPLTTLVELQAHPYALKLVATGQLAASWRQPRQRSWVKVPYEEVIAQIAATHGCRHAVHTDLQGVRITEYQNCPDSLFLARLAKAHDLTFQISSGCLVWSKKGGAQTVAGRALPRVEIPEAAVVAWHLRRLYTTAYTGVTAHWQSISTGERQAVTVGAPPQVLVAEGTWATKAEAKRQAKALLKKHRRTTHTLSLSLLSTASFCTATVVSDQIVVLPKSLHPSLPSTWTVERAEHHLRADGLTTDLTCEIYQ